MSLIATAAFILATQTKPSGKPAAAVSASAVASQSRLDEIWDHVDNRVIRQMDIWYDDGEFPTIVSLLKVQYAYAPDDYDTATNLGWMQENIELWSDAKETYRSFKDAHPTDGDAAFPLGWIYYQHEKDYAKAAEIFEASLKYNPRPNTYRMLASSYEKQKKYKDAIRIWELQLKRWPDELPAKANIKRVKAKMGGQ